MKPSSTSTALLFAMLMVVASNPLTSTAWARSDGRDLRINKAPESSDAFVLRRVTSDHRALAKGGNGGGNSNRATPSPTAAVTPAPTPTPPPVFQYPPVPYDSCGTRAPSTPAPSPGPSPAPQCENPPDGECNGNGGNQCCDGYSCKGKRCRLNLRRLGEYKVAFEETATEERKLADCVDHRCNEHNNEVLCGSDIPSSRPASIICNYGGGEYIASVVTCDGDVELCCKDGNGGYYYGQACWIFDQGATCCRKGYTRISSGCVPMNCCDGDADHQERYCPGKC